MRLLLIDGHYYVYRSFFAIPNLSNSRGEPTNAIFGFTKTLRLMVKHLQPELGAVVWDEGLPQKRVEVQPAYKDAFALLGEDQVTAKWDVPPGLIGDVLALTGDSVDNIPGIGIGRKGAAALIREFGGLELLLNNLDKVKSVRTGEKLANAREQILQNRKMVDLDCQMQLPVGISELRIKPDYPALIAALEKCEFKSLLQEVRDEAARLGRVVQTNLL